MSGTPLKVRFRSIFIRRFWTIPEPEIQQMAAFPVAQLLRPGGWIVIGCRPPEVPIVLELLKGWKLEFGTLAFRRHYPYKGAWKAWQTPKNHILREDLQEVVVIGYRPPYNARGLQRFATKPRPYVTNYPTRWEYDKYWMHSVLWGYPRLEIWGQPYQGVFDKRWTRVGPRLDGMPIGQSLWLELAKRSSTLPDMPVQYFHGA